MIVKKESSKNLTYYIKSDAALIRFETRLLLSVGWMLMLSIAGLLFVYHVDGLGMIWLPSLFFAIVLGYDVYATWHREMYLLTFLEIDSNNHEVFVRCNKYNKEYLNTRYDLNNFEAQVKALHLGQISVPNYKLLLKYNGKTVVKQKGGYVWPTKIIKNMDKEILAARNL